MLSPKVAIRKALKRAGYWTSHRSVLPFGIDYLWDIQRLAERHGIDIRCAFDIGAHSGDTAVEFLDSFPQAEIHSFEPHPDSFACVAKIDDPRLRAHRLAMSDKAGEATFHVYSELGDGSGRAPASANNSLVPNPQFSLVSGRNKYTIQVQCQTVDGLCAESGISSVELLKIDTEGHEVAVLDGAAKTLRDSVRFVFLEFETLLPVQGTAGGALAVAAERLEPLGFRYMASYPINMVDRPLYAAFNALFLKG
jgi:FkbM family methyltransferase